MDKTRTAGSFTALVVLRGQPMGVGLALQLIRWFGLQINVEPFTLKGLV
jgi:hypothetical protein